MGGESGKATFKVGGLTYTEGQRVSVVATFFDGSSRRVAGALILVKDAVTYIETSFGPVAGATETLEVT